MVKVIVIFASMTGNTEEMADYIADGVREAGAELTLKSVMDVNASVMENYDGIALGAYTWGDGDLPDEFLDFYEEMDEVDLTGKQAVAFGSCDSSYSEYGAAVDLLERKLEELGAVIALPGMKVELGPSAQEKEQLKQFGITFVNHLRVLKEATAGGTIV
ncbi:flavodoxin [Paenibacillus koleovorans]|uniref:flavodoxin n=1 Tax=Paenibacillus koleovorans TaxID=121608 RepID=UPI000FDCA0E6|nr:flavodoxin [Paenibacillus koleovorans]